MLTLGVAIAEDDAAVVAADSGIVVGAAWGSQVVPCAGELLARLGVDIDAVDRVCVVSTSPGSPVVWPPAALVPRHLRALASGLGHDTLHLDVPSAAALQMRAVGSAVRIVIVLDGHAGGGASVVQLTDSGATTHAIDGGPALLEALVGIADALGAESTRPIRGLEDLAWMGPRPTPIAPLGGFASQGATSILVDAATLAERLRAERRDCPAPLDQATPHVVAQQRRVNLASAILDDAAATLASVAAHTLRDGPLAFGGEAFSSAEFSARVERRCADAIFAPVSGTSGAALGAALNGHPTVGALGHLQLGAQFDDGEIKTALESCRLDYVYEPDTPKLEARVSRLLSTGALVGWFQGAAEIGPTSFGSRSVLCDPSSRYCRENVNVHLLHRDARAGLLLSVAESVQPWAPERPHALPTVRLVARATLPPGLDRLASAVAIHDRALVHHATTGTPPAFRSLLETHRRLTDVSGLVNVPLGGPAGLAASPVEAIRLAFSSAVDVLAMGRFLVGKDYWLLRGQSR